MYKRDLDQTLGEYAHFPAVALLGPRQSGKITLVRATFPRHTYINL